MADPTVVSRAAAHILMLNERQAGRPFAPYPRAAHAASHLEDAYAVQEEFQKLLTTDLWFYCRVIKLH